MVENLVLKETHNSHQDSWHHLSCTAPIWPTIPQEFQIVILTSLMELQLFKRCSTCSAMSLKFSKERASSLKFQVKFHSEAFLLPIQVLTFRSSIIWILRLRKESMLHLLGKVEVGNRQLSNWLKSFTELTMGRFSTMILTPKGLISGKCENKSVW